MPYYPKSLFFKVAYLTGSLGMYTLNISEPGLYSTLSNETLDQDPVFLIELKVYLRACAHQN